MKAARPLAPAVRVAIAIRPLPSTLVNALVEAGLGVEPRRDDVEVAGGAVEAVERDRALDIRMPRNHRDREVGVQVRRPAPSRDQPRAGDRDTALKAAAELAVALNRDPDRPERRRQRDAASAMSTTKLGSLNGLLLGGGSNLSIWPQLTLPLTSRPRSRTPRATMR